MSFDQLLIVTFYTTFLIFGICVRVAVLTIICLFRSVKVKRALLLLSVIEVILILTCLVMDDW